MKRSGQQSRASLLRPTGGSVPAAFARRPDISCKPAIKQADNDVPHDQTLVG